MASKPTQKQFANIKWVQGEDKDKYSVGISTDWILNFDFEEWKSENRDPSLSYVIQWRQPAKKPARGWQSYDGLVMDVSSSVAQLEKKFKLYGGLKSPKNPALNAFESTPISHLSQPSDHHRQPGVSKDERGPPKPTKLNMKGPKKNTRDPRRRVYIYDSGDSENSEERETVNPSDIVDDAGGVDPVDHQEEVIDNVEDVEADGEALINVAAQGRNVTAQRGDGNDGGPPVGDHGAARRAENVLNAQQQANQNGVLQRMERFLDILERREAVEAEEAQTVEIGERGSGIRISRDKWDTANEQSTFTAMALSLVTSLFDADVLLHSNVKGGKSKIHKAEDNAPRYDPLDKNILNAITVAVRKRFPQKFSRSGMHVAINSKLSAIRCAAKKAAQNLP